MGNSAIYSAVSGVSRVSDTSTLFASANVGVVLLGILVLVLSAVLVLALFKIKLLQKHRHESDQEHGEQQEKRSTDEKMQALEFSETQRLSGVGHYIYNLAAGTWNGSEVLDNILELDREEDRPADEWFSLVHPDDLEMVKERFADACREKREYFDNVYRITASKSKSVKWVRERAKVRYADDGEPIKMVGTIQDITSIKETENRLREEGEEMKSTLESMDDVVLVLDYDGKCLKVQSPGGGDFPFLLKEDLLGKNIKEIMPDKVAEQTLERIKTIITGGKTPPLEYYLDQPQGRRIFSSTLSPWKTKAGAIAGVTAVIRDITEAREEEERMQHAQKLESIGQLAGGVAHDFNNMLSGIMGAAEVLSLKDGNDSDSKKYIQLILDASERASQLTKKLLDFSRKGKVVTRDVNMQQVLQDTMDLLKRSIDPRITIVSDFKAENHMIKGDPSQLHNAVLNLAVNARDAMPEGGVLTFATATVYLDKNVCTQSGYPIEPGCFLEMSIKDTGVGINAEHQKNIYDPFFTTKPTGKGTGLGLSAVDGATREHRGMVTCSSELGKGSVFKIYLPVAMIDDFRDKATEELKVVQSNNAKILVIDDELVVRSVVEAMLKSFGYDVVTKPGGKEGVEYFKGNMDSIDLIILDVIMPVMDGRETYHKLKEINKDVKILFSSGFTKENNISDLIGDGACGFIQKPYRRQELSDSICMALGFLNMDQVKVRK